MSEHSPNCEEIRRLLVRPISLLELEAARARAEDYDGRNGYRSDFLGSGDLLVPIPLLKDADDLVPVARARADRPFELCYQNFSVVMSRRRRLCCITAVNIDGGAAFFHPKRPGWKTDPRVPSESQVDGTSFYEPTVFDRGHMVRRLDPVWGIEGTALLANADTHHYTNSCPQVHSFNDGAWGDLEDWILSQEQTQSSKGTVLTGPVFDDDNDPVYEGVAVPTRYFKVIVVVDDSKGTLSVTAFIKDQSKVLPPPASPELPGVGEPTLEAVFDPGEFEEDQLTLAELEDLTGLAFGRLKEFDVLAALPLPEAITAGGRLRLPLADAREAVLWAP